MTALVRSNTDALSPQRKRNVRGREFHPRIAQCIDALPHFSSTALQILYAGSHQLRQLGMGVDANVL